MLRKRDFTMHVTFDYAIKLFSETLILRILLPLALTYYIRFMTENDSFLFIL